MATYVLVHGGGHGGWCYAKVAQRLRAAGHEVYAPSLTGCGDRAHLVSPAVDLDMHIRDVVHLLLFEDLWDIDTGHDLMVTEPDFVARTLQEIAADEISLPFFQEDSSWTERALPD
jgi:hypothetical protein